VFGGLGTFGQRCFNTHVERGVVAHFRRLDADLTALETEYRGRMDDLLTATVAAASPNASPEIIHLSTNMVEVKAGPEFDTAGTAAALVDLRCEWSKKLLATNATVQRLFDLLKTF
jgi:hypothetical protein